MSIRKDPTIWKAEPHTIAKVQILQYYLFTWFSLIGRSRLGAALLYVDGFAGPGKYTNHATGSPIAALRAAKEAKSNAGAQWRAGSIRQIFIEENRKRSSHLEEHLRPFTGTEGIEFEVFNGTFVEGLTHVREKWPDHFRKSLPLFVFIDPFGATGAPFSAVAEILASPCSEVLINLDADGVARIFQAGATAKSQQVLDGVFGSDSWHTEIDWSASFSQQCRQVLALYKTRLKSLHNVRFVFPFEMRSSTGYLNYYLVFASQHPTGLEKMKEAMKRLDQDGTYSFSDARVGQSQLFRFDRPDEWALQLHKYYSGRTLEYTPLRDYALNETPFVNPKGMLKYLESNEGITVQSRDPKRRKGTFNEVTLISITFVESVNGNEF